MHNNKPDRSRFVNIQNPTPENPDTMPTLRTEETLLIDNYGEEGKNTMVKTIDVDEAIKVFKPKGAARVKVMGREESEEVEISINSMEDFSTENMKELDCNKQYVSAIEFADELIESFENSNPFEEDTDKGLIKTMLEDISERIKKVEESLL